MGVGNRLIQLVLRRLDGEARRLQPAAHEIDDSRLVLDDEHPRRHRRRRGIIALCRRHRSHPSSIGPAWAGFACTRTQ